ncbi:unnamed protein product [Rotaria socialis]|uniref:Uncharacterized protein n=1 Tax=Rotaria socialis TaxID=392032 RepID=A0A821CQP6_9BILA|nr:unnamed protein product [Rotaria socialis]CAF4610741.1 unnamed protein product [Rotaria socialis]
MLQLILFVCDESAILQLVRSMHNSEFRQTTTTTAESSQIEYSLRAVCCGRQCLRWYKTKTGNHHSPTDIRTYGDILFLYEGIFDYCNRPGLAVSYLDLNDIEETNVADMTRLVRTLSMIELHRQAENISGARQNSILRHSDYNAFDIKASAEEFDLMRKFFKQNSRQTKDARQHDLIEP